VNVARVLVAAALITLPACGRSGPACGAVETLVEPTEGHVIPPAAVPYAHHPPTSGRHYPDAPAPGVHRAAIAEPVQVAALERGWVFLQYARGRASSADRRALEEVAKARQPRGRPRVVVVVAPAARIDERAAVAMTAWDHRQLCRRASVPDAARFVVSYSNRAAAATTTTR
jgi:hypothetical protein